MPIYPAFLFNLMLIINISFILGEGPIKIIYDRKKLFFLHLKNNFCCKLITFSARIKSPMKI